MAKINSSRKGKVFEREVCKLLTEKFGVEFFRTAHSGAYATNNKKKRNMEDQQGDVTYDFQKLSWVKNIECKHYKKINIVYDLLKDNSNLRKWIQKLDDSGVSPWMLFVKSNNNCILVLTRDAEKLYNDGKLIGEFRSYPTKDYGSLYVATIDCIKVDKNS